MKNLTIRLETEKDYRAVEELTREAFWNVYKPGADEHYYVHQMRQHPDFIPELAFVLELDDKIVGSIMYTRAWLEGENGTRKEILSFGPLCVAPEYQRQKFGKILIEHSFEAARKVVVAAEARHEVVRPLGDAVEALLHVGGVVLKRDGELSGRFRVVGAAGEHGSDHDDDEQQREKLLQILFHLNPPV